MSVIQNQNQNNKQKIIWSSIRNKLNISLHHENVLALLRPPEVQEILHQFLSFYTSGDKSLDIPNNSKFLGKYAITPVMKDLIINIASCLNMTRTCCFELLDSYFSLYNEEYEKISYLLNLSNSFEDQSSQRYQYIITDLEDKKSKIIEFYFKERKNLILFLLDIFFQIFLEVENIPGNLLNFMDNFIRSKNMLQVFYNQLISYRNFNEIFNKDSLNNRIIRDIIKKVPMYLCEEQNLILELIVILVHQGKYNDAKIFEGLLTYFISTHFFCQSYNINMDNNDLKDEIMIKSLLIILGCFQSDIINKISDGENNLINNIIFFKNEFNFQLISTLYNQPQNNRILLPIKLTINSIIPILKKFRAQINNSQQKIAAYDNIHNINVQERDCFLFLNFIDEKIQTFEGNNINIEKGLTLYDIYYDILYDWINMIMKLHYEEKIDHYEPLMYQLLFRIISHLLPQRKFYTSLLGKKNNNITNFFNIIKREKDFKDIFLNFCFALSKSVEPRENIDEYLLNILTIEPIEDIKKELDELGDNDDINKKREIIEKNEKDIFFYNIFDEWNNLIEELYVYSQNQLQIPQAEALSEELSNKINYIRLFIRMVLPSDNFSNFIFNYAYYYNLKEKNNMNDINIDEDDMNYGVQEYDPKIFKELIFSSVTVLSLITELQIYNKNILFGEFITELLKLFILYAKDNHFVECLKFKDRNYFFEKFNGKNIIFNIIENDNNNQDFSNTLYAIKFIKEMFRPEIFLQIARNEEFNSPNKTGEIFYVSNFYYIKELINHFTQINDYLSPLNALLVSELNETMIQIMNYLEFKNNHCKIDVSEVQNNIDDTKNLCNFVIKLLMQDNKDYILDNQYMQNGNNNILLIDFIFKYLGIKINDNIIRNFNINEMKKKLFYNNLYIHNYLEKNRIQKENYNRNNSYNIGCYKKMILSSMNCLSKILSLIIIHNKQEKEKENNDEKNNLLKYTNINFINRLNYYLAISKEIPNYIYESIDGKRKYNLNIILLLFFYSLYEIEKNEQLIINKNNNIIDIEEDEQPIDLGFFMVDLKNNSHLNVSTIALNILCKILYIIKDNGINLNNNFTLEKNSASEINSNINLFKLIRYKMINILGSKNHDLDLLKIEIMKLLIISTKYQFSFVRNFIQGNDDIFYSDEIFLNLNNSLKYNINNFGLDNNDSDFEIKIERKNIRGELYTYILMFISELLNNTQDIRIMENLLIKENGMKFITNLINYGIYSCDISKNCDEFNKIMYQHIRAQNFNISDIFVISNSFKMLLDIFSIKLTIIEYLSILFKRVLLFSKQSKKINIKFKYSKELKYFVQNHIKNLVEFFAKIGEFNDLKNMMKNIQKELLINGIQIKLKNISDNEIINKDNLEMIIQDYLYCYDYNYSLDIKEIIVKGFYDALFRDKYLKNIVLNNCFTCYNYLLAQSLSQAAHLYGLVFSIGEYNYLLTDKLFTNVEIYKVFKDIENNKKLKDSYNEEINSLLAFDSCYNYKLTFNPLKDFCENNENVLIKFVKDYIITKCLNVDPIPNLTSNDHRLYYQMINCSLDYIIYLHNKSICSKNIITTTIDFSEFLKKLIIVLDEGIKTNSISDSNLLSVFNTVYHIIYYLVLTEKDLNNEPNEEINNDFIDMDNNYNDKIQIIMKLMDSLIIIFKKIKECRSIILYIFACIVYIKNDLIKKPIKKLFDIILKLYTKENDSFEFQSFLLLLNRLKINYPILLLDIMKDPQIFNFIYMKCGYNSYINLYKDQMHNSEHLIYIWTLDVFNNILNTYLTKISNELKPNYNIVISNIIKFMELIQQRFKELFSLCGDSNFLSGFSSNNYISLAYLQELKSSIEFITSFISIECDNSCPLTKDNSFLEFLFDSMDMISNTCLFLYKNDYKNLYNSYKPNSKVEKLMLNTKIINKDLSEGNDINEINNENEFYNNDQFENMDDDNFYRNMFKDEEIRKKNNNDNNINISINNNNSDDIIMNSNYFIDKSANVFHFKIKTNIIIILFNISSSMIQLLNRQNYNLKKYCFDKYQLKENETQLKIWPMLYLSSIKFASDFLKDIINNLKMYKILYNKSIILLNSINVSLGNCFLNDIEPEYPLNELVDLLLFILTDFCEINSHYNEFIELIIKNHPYINNSRAILGEVYQLSKSIKTGLVKYAKDFDEDDSFLTEFEDLQKQVELYIKSIMASRDYKKNSF